MIKLLKRFWNWLCSLFGGRGRREKKEFEQSVSKMQEELQNMKVQTEAVTAAQEKRKRQEAELREEISKMTRYTQKALNEGRDSDAAFFKDKKESLEKQLDQLLAQSGQAADYTAQAERLYRQAESELNEITARRDAVAAKMAAADLMQSMNDLNNSAGSAAMNKADDDAQRALDKAEAMAELDGRRQEADLQELMKKYDREGSGENLGSGAGYGQQN